MTGESLTAPEPTPPAQSPPAGRTCGQTATASATLVGAAAVIIAAAIAAPVAWRNSTVSATSGAYAANLQASAMANDRATQIAAAVTARASEVAYAETKEARQTLQAPSPTPHPTVAPTGTRIPGILPEPYGSVPGIPFCPADRPIPLSALPCWYMLDGSTDWEILAAQFYDLDLGTSATLLRNNNRDAKGFYLPLQPDYQAAVYVPNSGADFTKNYPRCTAARWSRRYPCMYEVQAGDARYRDIVNKIYGIPDYDKAVLDANQYYDSAKREWFKRELLKGRLIIMPRFQ